MKRHEVYDQIGKYYLLAAVCVITLCIIHAAAFFCYAEDGEFAAGDPYTDEHGVTYTWETNGETIRITGLDCDAERYEIIIPAEIEGKPVTELFSEDGDFTVNEHVTVFGIPDTIHEYTMTDAYGSTYDLFGFAENLEEIRVSDTHPTLASEDGILYNKEMTRLIKYPGGKPDAKYVMPDSVTEVRASALKSVQALEELVLSDKVTYLQYSVCLCPKLRRVYLGMLDNYNSMTLKDCTELEELSVSANNTSLTAVDGDLYTSDMKTLVCHPPKGSSDEVYRVRDGVEYIADFALSYADYKEVELPDTLTSVDECAFEGCPNLELLIFPDSIKTIGGYQFWGCTSLKYIYIPASVEDISDFTKWSDQVISLYGEPGSPAEEYAAQHTDTARFVNINEEKIPQSITCDCEDLIEPADGDGDGQPDGYASVKVQLGKGSVKLAASARRGVTFASDDPAVAEIDENGLITLKSTGTALIHIMSNIAAGEEKYFAQTEKLIEITVIPNENEDDPIITPPEKEDEEAVISPEKENVATVTTAEKKSQTIKGKTSFTKTYGSIAFSLRQSAKTSLKYKSSNTKVARVSSTGKVKIVRPGKVTITVTAAESNEYKSAVKTVTVEIKVKRPVVRCKSGKGKARIRWSKVPEASGYVLYIKYPGSKKYVRALTTKSKVKGLTHGDLRKGMTYRYKLRAFVRIGGKKYYSAYSKAKKARVK